MGLLNKLARLAAITTLLGGTAALVAAAAPAASSAATAAPAAQVAWVRIAHLSPRAPAMDIYMYPFGEPGHPTVLRDVSYGECLPTWRSRPGQYTVAMRGFGAPASSPPVPWTHELHGDRADGLHRGRPSSKFGDPLNRASNSRAASPPSSS